MRPDRNIPDVPKPSAIIRCFKKINKQIINEPTNHSPPYARLKEMSKEPPESCREGRLWNRTLWKQ